MSFVSLILKAKNKDTSFLPQAKIIWSLHDYWDFSEHYPAVLQRAPALLICYLYRLTYKVPILVQVPPSLFFPKQINYFTFTVLS